MIVPTNQVLSRSAVAAAADAPRAGGVERRRWSRTKRLPSFTEFFFCSARRRGMVLVLFKFASIFNISSSISSIVESQIIFVLAVESFTEFYRVLPSFT